MPNGFEIHQKYYLAMIDVSGSYLRSDLDLLRYGKYFMVGSV